MKYNIIITKETQSTGDDKDIWYKASAYTNEQTLAVDREFARTAGEAEDTLLARLNQSTEVIKTYTIDV